MPSQTSRIVVRAFQCHRRLGQDLFGREMATQKHLNRECEGGLLFEDQCSPHAFLIDFKVSACHVFALLVHALAAIYAGRRP